MSSRLAYSWDELLRLRNPGVNISRKTKRTLWYYKLLNPSPSLPSSHNSSTSISDRHFSNPIPVRITNRDQFSRPFLPNSKFNNSNRNLINIRLDSSPRHSKQTFQLPSVLYFNARSLKNKIDELISRCRQYQPNIVIITETWLDHHVPDSFLTISDYVILRCDRDSHGGGVAVFIKKTISHEIVSLTPSNNFKSNILACRLVELSVIWFCFYHPYYTGETLLNTI